MRIEHHDWQNVPDQAIVYGFRCSVDSTTILENAVVGQVIEHTVKITPQHWGSSASCYRAKKDGSFYKKSSCRWSHRFYNSQQEAEDARKQAIAKLKETLQDKIDYCQKRLSSL